MIVLWLCIDEGDVVIFDDIVDFVDDDSACGACDNDAGVDGAGGADGQKDQMKRCCIASGHHLWPVHLALFSLTKKKIIDY